MSPARAAQPIALVVRGGVVESVHHGHVVALGADGSRSGLGDPAAPIFARSSLKPLQAVAMLRGGLDLDDAALALACASHNGEAFHLTGVREVLAGSGLSESDLRNTPDVPIGDEAAVAWRAAGTPPSSLAQNCSGKHAAMLATCVAAGWDTATYLSPEHPLQRAVRDTVAELTGDDPEPVSVDGCGAPLFSCTTAGLARAFARIAAAPPGSPEHRVAGAMGRYPELVGGTGRDVTALMAGVPSLIAKDGAEGVYAAALPDGRTVALKVLDGSQRPRPVVMAAALRHVGVDAPVLTELGTLPVLGHGEPVGAVTACALEPLG